MRDRVSLLKKKGELIGFRVNNQKFYVDESGSVEVQVRDLKGFRIGSIPKGIWLRPLKGNAVIFEGMISSTRKYPGIASLDIHVYRKYWDHKFGATQYFNAMKQALEVRQKSARDVNFVEIEVDGAHVFFRYEIFLRKDMPVDRAVRKFMEIVHEVEGHTERILDKEEISPDTLSSEEKYTIEVLLPLFRSMSFVDVRYNHGKREFGRDITFSEIDKFGAKRNYGVQVKAGNLSGEAGSELDKIMGQIQDAFSMPYIETTSSERRYISDLIIAISGRFTENAKDKIIEKLSRHNVYFLDIDKTQELLIRYMKRSVRAS